MSFIIFASQTKTINMRSRGDAAAINNKTQNSSYAYLEK